MAEGFPLRPEWGWHVATPPRTELWSEPWPTNDRGTDYAALYRDTVAKLKLIDPVAFTPITTGLTGGPSMDHTFGITHDDISSRAITLARRTPSLDASDAHLLAYLQLVRENNEDDSAERRLAEQLAQAESRQAQRNAYIAGYVRCAVDLLCLVLTEEQREVMRHRAGRAWDSAHRPKDDSANQSRPHGTFGADQAGQ